MGLAVVAKMRLGMNEEVCSLLPVAAVASWSALNSFVVRIKEKEREMRE